MNLQKPVRNTCRTYRCKFIIFYSQNIISLISLFYITAIANYNGVQ